MPEEAASHVAVQKKEASLLLSADIAPKSGFPKTWVCVCQFYYKSLGTMNTG